MSNEKLVFQAGKRTLETIRSAGLASDDVKIVAEALVVVSSESVVYRLTNARNSDRMDLYRYAGFGKTRFACWQHVADAGKFLAENFIKAAT